jgi:hypothetical protein
MAMNTLVSQDSGYKMQVSPGENIKDIMSSVDGLPEVAGE